MFTGSLVALVTPMYQDGQIDWEALSRLVQFHLTNGTDGLVIAGTTGESPNLQSDEFDQLIERVVTQVNGVLPVIAGTGMLSTEATIKKTEKAKALGADGSLLVTPYYIKPTQEGLYQHFLNISEAVDLPHILYNVPSRTGVDLLPSTVQRLASRENIVAIKDATGDMGRAKTLISSLADQMAVLSGDDATALELMTLGGKGVITASGNVAPKIVSGYCKCALLGDLEKARALNEKVKSLHHALFVEPNPIPVKWALKEMGMIDSGIRAPLTMLSKSAQLILHQALIEAGIL